MIKGVFFLMFFFLIHLIIALNVKVEMPDASESATIFQLYFAGLCQSCYIFAFSYRSLTN